MHIEIPIVEYTKMLIEIMPELNQDEVVKEAHETIRYVLNKENPTMKEINIIKKIIKLLHKVY